MTITYENTEEDALAWNRYRVFHLPQTKREVARQRIAVSLIIFNSAPSLGIDKREALRFLRTQWRNHKAV